jgi:hypothetical protein
MSCLAAPSLALKPLNTTDRKALGVLVLLASGMRILGLSSCANMVKISIGQAECPAIHALMDALGRSAPSFTFGAIAFRKGRGEAFRAVRPLPDPSYKARPKDLQYWPGSPTQGHSTCNESCPRVEAWSRSQMSHDLVTQSTGKHLQPALPVPADAGLAVPVALLFRHRIHPNSRRLGLHLQLRSASNRLPSSPKLATLATASADSRSRQLVETRSDWRLFFKVTSSLGGAFRLRATAIRSSHSTER